MLTPRKRTDNSLLDTLSVPLNRLQRRELGIRLGRGHAWRPMPRKQPPRSRRHRMCRYIWTLYEPYRKSIIKRYEPYAYSAWFVKTLSMSLPMRRGFPTPLTVAAASAGSDQHTLLGRPPH
jgi:hypothetical protein